MDIEYNIRDGELLYLGQYLFCKGHDIQLLDYYARPANGLLSELEEFNPDFLVAHVWRSELILNARMPLILDELARLKRRLKFKIIAIGSMASAMHKEIIEYNDAVDFVVAARGIYSLNDIMPDICLDIRKYFGGFSVLTHDFLHQNVDYQSDDIVGLHSSRGCLRKCSFCSYNSDLTYGWKERDIKDLVSDIKIIHDLYGVTQFTLFDSNFSSNIKSNEKRARLLAKEVSSLSFEFDMSLNFSAEGLNKNIINDLKMASVKSILIGLESLNEQTLIRYNKKQNIGHTISMIEYAEEVGIIPVVSYILFNPWMTIDGLKSEIERIEKFGRYKIPHFLANSELIVIPGTTIERLLRQEKLLIENKFYRNFIFKDKEVEEVHSKLTEFFRENISAYSSSIYSLAELKMKEWDYLKSILGLDNVVNYV